MQMIGGQEVGVDLSTDTLNNDWVQLLKQVTSTIGNGNPHTSTEENSQGIDGLQLDGIDFNAILAALRQEQPIEAAQIPTDNPSSPELQQDHTANTELLPGEFDVAKTQEHKSPNQDCVTKAETIYQGDLNPAVSIDRQGVDIGHSDRSMQDHNHWEKEHAVTSDICQKGLQSITDDCALDLSGFEDLDTDKLLELQNMIQGFGSDESFKQLLQEFSNNESTLPAESSTSPIRETQVTPNNGVLASHSPLDTSRIGHTSDIHSTCHNSTALSNANPDIVNASSVNHNRIDSNSANHQKIDENSVNFEEVQPEALSVTIERLIAKTNVDLPSLSEDTQLQLNWLVQHLGNMQQLQDEEGDDEDDEDDKSKSTTAPELPVVDQVCHDENLAQIRRAIQSPKRMSAKNKAEQARIREENRERKKRWRESNQDRNKDNDLRCRVTKRAAKLYGLNDTEEKKAWMEAEFQKRKEKREAKERARYHEDRISSSPCFLSYGQQHHNYSGGISTTFSPSFRSLANTAGGSRASLESQPDQYEGPSRDRANSVAESTASSLADGEISDSAAALKLLSDPEAAQKLLQNSQVMELLSSLPEIVTMLHAVVGSGDVGEQHTSGAISGACKPSTAENAEKSTQPTAPESTISNSKPQMTVGLDTTSSVAKLGLYKLTEAEVEAKLSGLDSETAQNVLHELMMVDQASQLQSATRAHSEIPINGNDEMELDPDVQRILESPNDTHQDTLDLTLVNDRLSNISNSLLENIFPFSSIGSSDNNLNGDDSFTLDPNDIDKKLFQALQGALQTDGGNTSVYPSPKAPPPTPQKVNKRSAPTTDDSLESRKRHQPNPPKAIAPPELNPMTARAFVGVLQTSGIDLQKFGIAGCSPTPAAPAMSPPAATPPPAPLPLPAYPAHTLHCSMSGGTTSQSTQYMTHGTYTVSDPPHRPTIPKPPATASSNTRPLSAAAAHAASFGNSAAMNQRLMPPPAYRPPNLGIGYGGFSPVPTIPKKKPDERIVKAMGFPPMLAGIKKKTSPSTS
ncbi:hypothetical protein BDZ91DRAFT_201661 [Kalaharituber pfeilii]|nr:hypothetical protein BDZ91DRAFT_201661 [Kalaharituber pfeilii]